jgi:16S rRNA (guanine1207-N2)-methyltransferase
VWFVIQTNILGIDLKLETTEKLFSPGRVDDGTLAMLRQVQFGPDDKVLDLGCGYGAIGVVVAKLIGPETVFLLDSDPLAITYAAKNLKLNGVDCAHCVLSDGFRSLSETGFTKILCNPPYHTDFSVAKHMIEKGFNRLAIGGALWMVTKRDTWYRNKLSAVFGGVRLHSVDGYYVFEAIKMSATYANRNGSGRAR